MNWTKLSAVARATVAAALTAGPAEGAVSLLSANNAKVRA